MDLYTKQQVVLLKCMGKKKDAVFRWLAWWEIVAGIEHEGKIDPCKYLPWFYFSKGPVLENPTHRTQDIVS
jgi:hypothetical protein